MWVKSKKIKSQASCDLCGNKDFILIYRKRGNIAKKYLITDNSYGTHPQIVQCTNCGLIFVSPRESNQAIIDRYINFDDIEYERERLTRGQNQIKILNKIKELSDTKGKLLDIGCATGIFLELAQKDGWETYGVEPSQWAANIAKKKYNLNVFNGTLNESDFAKDQFDAATCLDVIEHVTSPRDLLKDIYQVLKQNGLLCIVTPNKNSLAAKMLGEKWWHVRSDHIYYFSDVTLNKLLISTGFRAIAWKTYGWTFSAKYWITRIGKITPRIYNTLTTLLDNPIGTKVLSQKFTINFGDSLEVYCRKANK